MSRTPQPERPGSHGPSHGPHGLDGFPAAVLWDMDGTQGATEYFQVR